MSGNKTSATVPVVDARCGDPQHSGEDMGEYRMSASCLNCQARFVARFTLGHEANSYTTCPVCGVSRHGGVAFHGWVSIDA